MSEETQRRMRGVDDVLALFDGGPAPRETCPNCYHTQSMHDFVKVEPAAPTCSCVHPFHRPDPEGGDKE